MSEGNEGPKFCAKCKMENCIFLAFVEEFMLSKAWDVKKLILVEESSPDVNRILRKRLYHNFAFWFGNRGCRTQLPSCVTEGIRKKYPSTVFMGYKAKRDTVDNRAETLVGEKICNMRWHKSTNKNSYHCVKVKDEIIKSTKNSY